ncbi:Perilipin-2 [Coemansia sp. RSA 988]|nr:Perilipin-2 [Coemansia sp. RSA 988]
MAASLASSENAASLNSTDKSIDAGAGAACEDSRSETSTVETDSSATHSTDERSETPELTFFTRLYELPLVNDAVSSIYRIAESNRYTGAIISYAEKVGGLAEKSRPLLRPVERPIVALDGFATRSLEFIESKYPIVARPTDEVLESVQAQAKDVGDRYPVVARTFAVAKSTANSTLDRVDYLVDYVLPPSATASEESADDGHPLEEEEQQQQQIQELLQAQSSSNSDSPLGKVTILVHKVPQRLGKYYFDQLQSSKAKVGCIKQSVKDTVDVYESEISERSYRLLGSARERAWATVNTTIPSYLPQRAQQYYEHGKEILVTKATKLHAEYSRTDQDTRSKVLNLILISGEQVPVLEGITSRIFGKGMAASAGTGSGSPVAAAAE